MLQVRGSAREIGDGARLWFMSFERDERGAVVFGEYRRVVLEMIEAETAYCR